MTPETTPPLVGIKVADFGWAAVGPLTGKYLADHGATVVRIESHLRPDQTRVSSPLKDGVAGVEQSGVYPNMNSSKYSITLNLQTPAGQAIAWKLIRWADVVVETFSTGQMAKWGLDYESVRCERPDLVYFSGTPRGQTGRNAKARGYGPLVSALAGVYHLSGWPDRKPSPPQGAYADFVVPRFAVAAILAALDHRQRTGRGQYIDQSMLESQVATVATPVMEYAANGRNMNRAGNRLPYACPHGVFRCLGDERWCAIAVFDDGQWRRLGEAMGHPAWAADPRFATLMSRKQNEDELELLIEAWTITQHPCEVETKLQAARIACSVVQSAKDLFEDPQLRHLGYFRPLEHQVWGSYVYSGPSFRLSKTPDRQRRAPYMGEHNEYVLKEILGMSDDEIADCIVDGGITSEADLPAVRSGI